MPQEADSASPVSSGSLTVVGTGIDITTQLTPAARAAIVGADTVLYLLADPVAGLRVEALNARARSLDKHYGPDKDRRLTYDEIVETVVSETIAGAHMCFVVYGNPGIYVSPTHRAIAGVREAGLPARMLPAVSSLDCLVADLGIDPALTGVQIYEATYFLRAQPPVDPRAMLVLFQVGMLGESGGAQTPAVAERFPHLIELLRARYGEQREAVLYEASAFPGVPASIAFFRLDALALPTPSTLATLCVTGA